MIAIKGMTNEQAIKWLKDYLKNGYFSMPQYGQALEMAIQALSQEQKSGKWVEIDDEPHEVWECDHCGFVIDGSGCIEPYEYRDIYNYCPNCGAKMVEPQESEERVNE